VINDMLQVRLKTYLDLRQSSATGRLRTTCANRPSSATSRLTTNRGRFRAETAVDWARQLRPPVIRPERRAPAYRPQLLGPLEGVRTGNGSSAPGTRS